MKREPAHRYALILIDVINAYDFPGGERLHRSAKPMAARIAALKRRAKAGGMPVIYANDNYGRWRSDFRQVVAECGHEKSRGKELTQLLHPENDDFFVLKPMQSAFLSTPLGQLLETLSIDGVILTGIATDACVMATALDAHMRHYGVVVPTDCTASETPARKLRALKLLEDTIGVDTMASRAITRRNYLR